jgi:glycolate oxidase FAD binding subunit
MVQTFQPTTLAELERVVAWAVGEEAPLEVIGRGSKRGLGRPVQAKAELRLDRLSGIAMYEPDELVMSAGAGTPLIEIEAELAERQQELAFEPADYGLILGGPANRQSIGGVFACNLSGPRRIKSGAARDHLLGVQCVTGHAQVIKAGGRVMKNVTGYDVPKLLAGSFGTLAVMSQLTFKVLPASPDCATLLIAGADVTELLAALRRAMASSCEVSGSAVLPLSAIARSSVPELAEAGTPLAALRVEGVPASVSYRLDALDRVVTRPIGLRSFRIGKDATRTLWREIRNVRLADPEAPILWRVSCAPSEAAGITEQAVALQPELLFDWSGGLIWIASRHEHGDIGAEAIRRTLAAAGGGHATLIRAPEEVRRALPPFQPQPVLLQGLSARVKASFDPRGVLNPRRMNPEF